MTEHEDLMRSLLVERFRPWRPNEERDPKPTLLAREMGMDGRTLQRPTHHWRRSQTETNKGRQTT